MCCIFCCLGYNKIAYSATLFVLAWIVSSLYFVLRSFWSCFLILKTAETLKGLNINLYFMLKSPSAIGEDSDVAMVWITGPDVLVTERDLTWSGSPQKVKWCHISLKSREPYCQCGLSLHVSAEYFLDWKYTLLYLNLTYCICFEMYINSVCCNNWLSSLLRPSTTNVQS